MNECDVENPTDVCGASARVYVVNRIFVIVRCDSFCHSEAQAEVSSVTARVFELINPIVFPRGRFFASLRFAQNDKGVKLGITSRR